MLISLLGIVGTSARPPRVFVVAPAPRNVEEGFLEDGSEEHPFYSLEAARDAIRRGIGADRRRLVFLRAGTHYLKHPLEFDHRDV